MTRTVVALIAALGVPVILPAQQPPAQRVEHLYPDAEEKYGYSQAVEVGGTIYLSGTIGGGATMEEQVRAAYAKISMTLARFGATMKDVVKETVYTTDMEALDAANAVRKAAYGGHAPAATWVQITRLLSKGALLEIDVTAVAGSGAPRAP